jgi:hypothetical protein
LADYVAIAVRNARAFQIARQQPSLAISDRQRELEQLAGELQAALDRVKRLAVP